MSGGPFVSNWQERNSVTARKPTALQWTPSSSHLNLADRYVSHQFCSQFEKDYVEEPQFTVSLHWAVGVVHNLCYAQYAHSANVYLSDIRLVSPKGVLIEKRPRGNLWTVVLFCRNRKKRELYSRLNAYKSVWISLLFWKRTFLLVSISVRPHSTVSAQVFSKFSEVFWLRMVSAIALIGEAVSYFIWFSQPWQSVSSEYDGKCLSSPEVYHIKFFNRTKVLFLASTNKD